MRAPLLVLMLLSTPALALDQGQIRSACYTDCEKETGSNPDYKACLARAADTADALLNQEFTGLQDAVKAAAAIASNQEWRESRPAQFAVPETKLVEAVRELLARHGIRWD